MFYYCTSLQLLNITGWPDNSYTKTAMSSLPVGDDAKNEIYTTVYFTVPSGWEIISPLDILIYTCSKSGVKPTFNSGFSGYTTNETKNSNGIYRVKIATNALTNLPTSVSFQDKTELLTVEKINTSDITNMYCMFKGCSNLTSVDLSNCDCSKVTEAQSMFENCSKLKTVDISNTNMKLINMSNMFKNCTVLEEIKCNGWINESERGKVISRSNSNDIIRGTDKLKTDIFMYLATMYKMSYYENTDVTEPRILDFSGVDTSKLIEMIIRGNTTSIINLHSENGINLMLRYAVSLAHVEKLHFKWNSYGFKYYWGGADPLNVIFETTKNSTNYKYENWSPGNPDYVLRFNDPKYTVDTLVSFLECLYDYKAKGESTNASLTLGSNLQRLTSAQKAIATNKGWTLK
jgi:surface protein